MISAEADPSSPHVLAMKDGSFSTSIIISENTIKEYKGRVPTNSTIFLTVF
jgi:hypothetical protein